MQTIHRTMLAIGLAAVCATGLTAQTQETKTTTKTKIEVEGGRDVIMTGCLERRPNGDYILTEARENRSQEGSRYALVTSEDLSRRVGERVEVQGKAVVNGSGKVSIESQTKTEVEHGKDLETKTKTETEGTGGALGMPFLGVRSMKTLSSTCS